MTNSELIAAARARIDAAMAAAGIDATTRTACVHGPYLGLEPMVAIEVNVRILAKELEPAQSAQPAQE